MTANEYELPRWFSLGWLVFFPFAILILFFGVPAFVIGMLGIAGWYILGTWLILAERARKHTLARTNK